MKNKENNISLVTGILIFFNSSNLMIWFSLQIDSRRTKLLYLICFQMFELLYGFLPVNEKKLNMH